MLKGKGETIQKLSDWIDMETVGNIFFYHPPNIKQYGCYVEQTIKAREMNKETREAFETMVENLGALRGEFHRDKDGKPDRVKIIKAL